jgi:hypothetical protein
MVTVLLAAAADPDAAWVRLRSLPRDQRVKLLENLHRFELVQSERNQAVLRSLDRQLQGLDAAERSRYFDVLGRYHNWLNRLPEKLQDDIRSAAPVDRMALVRKVAKIHPVPMENKTPPVLSVADIGDFSPFEIASMYTTWAKATPAQRAEIEKLAAPARRNALRKLTKALDIPREIRPKDYDDEEWVKKLEARWLASSPILYEGLFGKASDAVPKKVQNLGDPSLVKEERKADIVSRQAINFYFMQASHRPKPVGDDNLALFVAALPPWIPSAFDQFAPDEARRRLSIIYRLVFPADEIRPPAAGVRGPGNPASKPGQPSDPATKKPVDKAKGSGIAPF